MQKKKPTLGQCLLSTQIYAKPDWKLQSSHALNTGVVVFTGIFLLLDLISFPSVTFFICVISLIYYFAVIFVSFLFLKLLFHGDYYVIVYGCNNWSLVCNARQI